ncbi:hypothetical protein PF003_g10586 [Phytophthora fragariae]|nr:hypothetical protein PF003_g10586 [Phytophthora fragariae]
MVIHESDARSGSTTAIQLHDSKREAELDRATEIHGTRRMGNGR